ncbi:G-protein coupled receptor Mth2-like isoform X4 [Phymastichus coffea]|uniref:G-protein coupled receptor Mth2-like isoform X4 n=1 Tax=Phymastichus coffea TaxID=108790 RepID=UPI00273B370E|nr:G-protein coupled receptor Mth2-like isoform X4 [Phymastichus coffea]
MIARVALLASALAASAWGYLLPNETECPSEALVDVTAAFGKGHERGSVWSDGVFYPEDAIVWTNGRALGCPCRTRACLSLCCVAGKCHEPIDSDEGFFPIYESRTRRVNRSASVRHFWQFAWNPCHETDRYAFEPELNPGDRFELFDNGSVYQVAVDSLRNYTDFCVEPYDNSYRVILCFGEVGDDAPNPRVHRVFSYGMLISVPFLLSTFVVYMLIPDLRNLHGQTLCAYVMCLVAAYVALSSMQIVDQASISDLTCSIFAYIVHFSFLASFFWLNVMCFDIWWTFGGFRSLHGSVKQRERKKFIMYSIYAWGCATVITTITMIMDLVPGIPDTMIRPEFGKGSCWFETAGARALYFYGPMGLTIICNICLFILTAVKIIKHKKDTARQLKGSDSRRHDDNKQWFNLYLKLFIVMGINWSMEIISWMFEDILPKYVWYLTDLTNTLQGVIIFIIFVWKDKIRRLLMKRFGCDGDGLFRNSTSRSGCATSSTSARTTCITSGAPLQEKVNPYIDSYARGKSTVTDDSDCI